MKPFHWLALGIVFWVYGGLRAEVINPDTSPEHNPYLQDHDTTDEERNVHEERIESAADAAAAIRDYFRFQRYVIRITPDTKPFYSVDLSGYAKLLRKGLTVSHSMEEAKQFLFLQPDLKNSMTPMMDRKDQRGTFARTYFTVLSENLERIDSKLNASPSDLAALARNVEYIGRKGKQSVYVTLASAIDPNFKPQSRWSAAISHMFCPWPRLLNRINPSNR